MLNPAWFSGVSAKTKTRRLFGFAGFFCAAAGKSLKYGLGVLL